MRPIRQAPLFVALVLLILTLVQNVSWAAPRQISAEDGALSVGTDALPLHRLWSFLVSTWQFAGCTVDPLGGGCHSGGVAPPAPADQGHWTTVSGDAKADYL